MVGKNQGNRSRNNHGDPITSDVQTGAESELFGLEDVRAISVNGDVLARTKEADEDREESCEPWRLRGMNKSHRRERNHEQDLRDENPAATAPEKWRNESVHQRRPKKLQRIGKSDGRKNTDGGQIHFFGFHPSLQRASRQRQGHP